MRIQDWFLTGDERGNPATRLDPWTEGNDVRPLVHGATYFAELRAHLERLDADDLLLFADWRGDPDERL
ncbi:phospholipase, partial [Nonomuraea fuscirosea]